MSYLGDDASYLITVGWLTFCFFGWKYTPMNLGEGDVEKEE